MGMGPKPGRGTSPSVSPSAGLRLDACGGRDYGIGGRDGLGLKLVSILAEQLRARLKAGVPAGGRGTLWRVELGSE